MEVTHALFVDRSAEIRIPLEAFLYQAYKNPVVKTAAIISFLLNGICNRQRTGIGRIRIAKSETTLKIPVARNAA